MSNIYKYDDDLFVQSFIEINEKFDILVMFINGSINASSQLAPLNIKSGILSISQINFPLFKPSPSKRHHNVLNIYDWLYSRFASRILPDLIHL